MAPGDGETVLGMGMASNGFVMGMASSHGMVAKQAIKDLDGKEIASINYVSTNIEKGHRAAQIVADDGSVLATFDTPKMAGSGMTPTMLDRTPHTILINGV